MNEKQFDKKIVLSVIIALCFISIITSAIELLQIFMMRNVEGVWYIPKVGFLIATFIISIIITVLMCFIIVRQLVINNQTEKNRKIDFIILNIVMVLILALIVLSIIHYNYFFGFSSERVSSTSNDFKNVVRIGSSNLTSFYQLFISTSSLVVAAIISTLIIYIPIVKEMKLNKNINIKDKDNEEEKTVQN